MEQKLSEVLDNLLGLLLLEGSYEIQEQEEGFFVSIDTPDAGRLIGFRGENLASLQQIVNQISGKGDETFKRVIIDVAGWRKQKEEELTVNAKAWAKEVWESKKEMELEPMMAWQRRIVHMVISETEGLATESVGEGKDRHIVIKVKSDISATPATNKPVSTKKSKAKAEDKNKDAEVSED